MNIIFLLTGYFAVFLVSWLFSFDRKNTRYKSLCILLILQFFISFLCLHTNGGKLVLSKISDFFNWLMVQAAVGVNFVFGGIVIKSNTSVFFFSVLMPIVFISALVGILNYIKVLPFIIKWTGWLLNKIAGMGELESYFAVSTAILGEPEVFLTIRDQLPKLDSRRLYTICASAMSSVSVAVLASYMKLVPSRFVVVAVFMNILSVLEIICIINPYTPPKDDPLTLMDLSKKNDEPFFQVLGDYIQDGFRLAINVAAMLIGFVALMALLNSTCTNLFNISFTSIIGYLFAPIAWLMGVPSQDILKVGSVMATKLIANEFTAMQTLNTMSGLSTKSIAIISSYLISYANFGTVGIITGAIRAIAPNQGEKVAKTSMKLLLGATMASVLTGTIVGFWY
ncbi:NupC/NupG family nucleoside CNT transporter [Limosilactobacillus mucosae]|uniref:Nucleoside transporter C-terminal domain-containing protein n=1 Tax=Limosilactobacillus mucosae TaxID=97478 RepID=A0AAJ1HM59_LIMMU|nr:nucleoside transporter C-terminal domain-containing protein [Limosilactobacillus mucosae]MDC2826936.1 nucleoside transporter C-terminal domain-containing protein [Limosilactobacillus mucosae]MDC2834635.1 nucleoside transporter C-terminal domain-containing protein [Limosilactobacillus mucosae]